MSEFKGKAPNIVRSFNLQVRPTGRSRCNKNETLAYAYSDDDSSSETELGDKETPVRVNRTAPTLVEASTNSPISSRTRNRTREYCTQACLLGLVRRTALDEDCLNGSAHRAGGHGRQHRISVKPFRSLVQAQLDWTLDQDCEPLWSKVQEGICSESRWRRTGILLWVKGRYQWSWLSPDLSREILCSVEEIRREVEHNNLRELNILWNREHRRVMLIDLEHSRLLAPTRRPPLQGLSPNKKRQQPFGDGKICRQRQRSMEGTYQRG
ncbi:hypothetical protein AJ80_09795 [Polytolypa hystricis UAMH7299]|uniref:Protein kinase domain-containing protein n=1 Tax=Polytolypa hystricis (strain UAMH7299) TaxID=1447883 RepID=A0A2B7WJR6_POLH7|nr:hypothetical protein AJ80_09795 [Polytolypa hystricis UAMH7299]